MTWNKEGQAAVMTSDETQDLLVVFRCVMDVALRPKSSSSARRSINPVAVILWAGQRSRKRIDE